MPLRSDIHPRRKKNVAYKNKSGKGRIKIKNKKQQENKYINELKELIKLNTYSNDIFLIETSHPSIKNKKQHDLKKIKKHLKKEKKNICNTCFIEDINLFKVDKYYYHKSCLFDDK